MFTLHVGGQDLNPSQFWTRLKNDKWLFFCQAMEVTSLNSENFIEIGLVIVYTEFYQILYSWQFFMLMSTLHYSLNVDFSFIPHHGWGKQHCTSPYGKYIFLYCGIIELNLFTLLWFSGTTGLKQVDNTWNYSHFYNFLCTFGNFYCHDKSD